MVGDDPMKSLNIIIITTTIAILAVATIGLALADNDGLMGSGGMMGSSSHNEDEDWLTEMRDFMDDHMDEVQDEEWYTDMRAYMDEHLDDVENQDWFDEMTEHMDDHMDDIEDEDWFDEMDEHMDDMMANHDHDEESQNSSHGCH